LGRNQPRLAAACEFRLRGNLKRLQFSFFHCSCSFVWRLAHNGFAEGLMRAIALGSHRALAVTAVRAFFLR
jgi:hypothetical protein